MEPIDWNAVIDEERPLVEGSRRARFGEDVPVADDLVGLALSGGGVRSATFNLGVVQALHKHGLWRYVDYASTVSGGGYLGSCLSSLLHTAHGARPWAEDFPLRHDPRALEGPELVYLRNNSKYLSSGRLGFLEFPVELARGVVLNLNIFLPLLLLALLGTHIFYGETFRSFLRDQELARERAASQAEEALHAKAEPAPAPKPQREKAPASLKKAWHPPLGLRESPQTPAPVQTPMLRGQDRPTQAPVIPGADRQILNRARDEAQEAERRVHMRYLLRGLGGASRLQRSQPPRAAPEKASKTRAPDPGTKAGAAPPEPGPAAPEAAAPMAGPSAPKLYELTVVCGLAFLTALVAYPILYLLLGRWRSNAILVMGLVLLLVCVSIESLPALLFLYCSETLKLEPWLSNLATGLTAAGSLGSVLLASRWADDLSAWTGKLAILVASVLGPVFLVLVYLILGKLFVIEDPASTGRFFLVAGAVCLLPYLLLSPNAGTFHGLYKRRLSKTYLIEQTAPGQVAARAAPLPLSGIDPAQTGAPYHLINATINLGGSRDPSLRGRDGDFFMFSPRHFGSERTGYAPIQELERGDPSFSLGSAMAVSGAAAAPNMGSLTIAPLRLLLALLNVRLGYWLPNPRSTLFGWRACRLLGPVYFLCEAFGWLNDRTTYVNVSDGGHLENLGVYELLRRECRLIVIGDGEADPSLGCGALATVIRLARIDLNARVDIDLRELAPDPSGLTSKHAAFGLVQYASGKRGFLVYLKSSVSGDEPLYVANYRTRHSAFPHQTTADQFFDEEQFEAYRALGHHVADEVFEGLGDWLDGRRAEPAEVVDWVKDQVRERLRPSSGLEDAFTSLQTDLSALEGEFQDGQLAALSLAAFPELSVLSQESADPANLREFHMCCRQIQLMENVFVALRLDLRANREDSFNRGWLNLFRRWGATPQLRRFFPLLIPCYSPGFQAFCREVLGYELRTQLEEQEGGRWTLSFCLVVDEAEVSPRLEAVGLRTRTLPAGGLELLSHSVERRYQGMGLLFRALEALVDRGQPVQAALALAEGLERAEEVVFTEAGVALPQPVTAADTGPRAAPSAPAGS